MNWNDEVIGNHVIYGKMIISMNPWNKKVIEEEMRDIRLF